VLPLENLSPDPDDAYFADAIHGEIINRLGTIEGLRVISRTSVMSYRQRAGSLREIAEELGVENILEGTVRRVGDRVRITAELIAAEHDRQVWSENYDRDIGDIFAIQADVAREVVRALSVALARSERERIEARPTDNMEAYDYYLRGLDYFGRGYDEGDLRVAQQMFEEATQLDPGFALAHARLSRTHARIYWFFYDHSQSRLEQAKQAVDRSLELEPDLPEAHEAMGWYYYYGFLDYENALQQFSTALERQPGNGDLLQGMGYVERRRGNLDAHLDYLGKAEKLDPRNGPLLQNIAQTHGRLLRNYAEAERYYDRALALAPDLPRSYGYKALLFLAWEGSTAKARAVLEEAAGKGLDSVDDPFVGYRWVHVDIFDGDYKAALERLSSGSSTVFNTQFYYLPKALVAAQIYDLMGDEGLAREHYDSAAALLGARLAEAPDEARLYSALGIAYAGLGRVEEAIRTASRGVDLLPVSREAHRGLWRVEDLARVYVMVGYYDEAIDQLDYLLSIPGDLSVPLLRIDPTWTPLRELQRFRAVMTKYE
jgi:serine/threonine-protein kinase